MDLPFKLQSFIDNERISSGTFFNPQITSIYAPLSTPNTAQNTNFFHTDVVAITLQSNTKSLLVGGDWNAVLQRDDMSSPYNFSQVLQDVVTTFELVDTWRYLRPTKRIIVSSQLHLVAEYVDGTVHRSYYHAYKI